MIPFAKHLQNFAYRNKWFYLTHNAQFSDNFKERA